MALWQDIMNQSQPGLDQAGPTQMWARIQAAGNVPQINPQTIHDPVSLNKAYKAGQISKQQFQDRLFQIQSPKGAKGPVYSRDVIQGAVGKSVADFFVRPIPRAFAELIASGQPTNNAEETHQNAGPTMTTKKLGPAPIVKKTAPTPTVYAPKGRIGKILLGDTPVTSIQAQAEGAKTSHPGGFHVKGTPITLTPEETKVVEGLGKLGIDTATVLTAGKAGMAKFNKVVQANKDAKALVQTQAAQSLLAKVREAGAKPAATEPAAALKVEQPTVKTVPLTKTKASAPVTPETGDQMRGFTRSVKQSSEYTPELRKKISSQYSIFTDKKAIEGTNKFLDKPFEQAHKEVLDRLQSGERGKQIMNDAGTVMQILDSKGRTEEANVIHDQIAPRGTSAGQEAQALSLLYRRSPEGMYRKAIQDIKRGGGKVTDNVDAQLQQLKDEIRKTEPDTPERQFAVEKMKQFVEHNVPQGAANKIYAVWRSGLITGARTLTKVATSHVVHGAMETIKDVPASIVDATAGRLLSKVFTGEAKRSQVLTLKGSAKGTVDAIKHQGRFLRTGIDTSRGANQDFHSSIWFGKSVPGRIANAYVNGPGRLHGAIYNTAAGGAHLRSLYKSALAEAKNQGLKGAEKDKFVEDFVAKPPKEADAIAHQEAEVATMRQKTLMSEAISRLQSMDKSAPKGMKTGAKAFSMVAKIIAPFQRIPSAIAIGMIDYSPAGAMKAIVRAAIHSKEEGWTTQIQREFSNELGRSITGTTGAFIPGYILYNKGMITTEYPNDPKEQKLWEMEGRTPWSIKIDGKWRSLGTLGPAGMVMALGAGIAQSRANGADMFDATVSGIATGVKSLQEQSYLAGVNSAVNALNNPNRYMKSLEDQYASSIIPTLISNYTATHDQYKRQANTPLQAIEKNLPGFNQNVPLKKDSFGNSVPTPETGVAGLVDPFYSSAVRDTGPVGTELRRLQDAGYGIMPSTQAANQTLGDYTITLNKNQIQEMEAKRGQALQGIWGKLIENPMYKQLPDYQKQQILSKVESDVTNRIKTVYLLQQAGQKNVKIAPKSAPKKKA